MRAFQYDFLQQLNEINGDALLDEQIRQAWFGSKAGGYSWIIVENNSDGSTGTTLTEGEQEWLFQLNQAQAALDAALTTLYSLQWELHALWLKNGFLSDSANTFPVPPDGVDDLGQFQSQLAGQLSPTQPGSTAAQLVAQFASSSNCCPRSRSRTGPAPTTPSRRCRTASPPSPRPSSSIRPRPSRRPPAPRYWQANNPVVMRLRRAGATVGGIHQHLAVRPADDLVTGFTVGTSHHRRPARSAAC